MSIILKCDSKSVEAFLNMVDLGYGDRVRQFCEDEISNLSTDSFNPKEVLSKGRDQRDRQLSDELMGKLVPSQEATFCSKGVDLK